MADFGFQKIGELLVEKGVLSVVQLNEALEEQRLTGEKLGEILIKKGWIRQKELDNYLNSQKGIIKFDLSSYIIDPAAAKLISEDFARKYMLMPVFRVENTLTVAMKDPSNVFIIDELKRLSGLDVEAVMADEMDIKKAQNEHYSQSTALREIIASIDKEKLLDGAKLGEEAPIIKIANHLIIQAVQLKASDIHIEPEEKSLNVRYRVDGVLYLQPSLPKDLSDAVISRFKIMSGLDIAEKRLPQDGRILLKVGSKDIDFRVSTCPTVHGENVVLRILDRSGLVLGLESLGFEAAELTAFKEIIRSPYGIILVTGPTGSGKTTTLYSALHILNKPDQNIMTVEDPVEYQFPGIRQVQVNPKAGLDFAAILRSFLRQDPNILMVGEIRDRETAEIAIQAALTGHLVFSTLHTNNAATTFTRLIDMGIEPFLISSGLLCSLAQRLVRKICDKCKEPYSPGEEVLKSLNMENPGTQEIIFYRGRGCQLCNKSGYKGRLGIYEFLKVSLEIQRLVLKRAPAEEISRTAVKEGMSTLRKSALAKLLAGLTTPQEVIRVTLEAQRQAY